MSYIEKLYQDLQDEATLKDFVNQVLFNGKETDFKVWKLRYLEINGQEASSVQLKVMFGDNEIVVASFADYVVKYCNEGEWEYQIVDGHRDVRVRTFPSPRLYNMKRFYLQYMASHYEKFKEDCKNNKIAQKEKEKQEALDWLEGVFASTQTPNP